MRRLVDTHNSSIESHVLKAQSRLRNKEPMTIYQMYLYLALLSFTGILRKSTIKNYFNRDSFIETTIFPQIMSQNRLQLISYVSRLGDDRSLEIVAFVSYLSLNVPVQFENCRSNFVIYNFKQVPIKVREFLQINYRLTSTCEITGLRNKESRSSRKL